jgi:hypothetical protein
VAGAAARRGVRVVSGYHQGTGIVEPEDFVWQYQQDEQWCDIPDAGPQNDARTGRLAFPEITSRRLRLLITATHIDVSRIWEIEVLGRSKVEVRTGKTISIGFV